MPHWLTLIIGLKSVEEKAGLGALAESDWDSPLDHVGAKDDDWEKLWIDVGGEA